MTASRLSSVAVDRDRENRKSDTRLWTKLVIALGAIVICLNALLFLLVQEQDHSIAARETEVQRRFVAVEAQEARRTGLQKEIRDLESRKAVAEKQAEDAERAAADAAQLITNRDRALNELRDAQVEGSRQRADADSLKNQILTLRAEEASLRKERSERETAYLALKSQYNEMIGKAETARKEANDAAMLKADAEAAFRELQARRQELAKAQVELESARSAKSVLMVDQAATQKALAARSEAEGALSKAQGELQVLQDQIAKARAVLAQIEERRKNASFDEGATNRATTARLEAEKALMKTQGELSSVSSQLSAAQDQLLVVQRQRASISLDTAAAHRAATAREEAEASLAKTREELDGLRSQVAEATERRDAILADIERLQKLSGPWNPAPVPAEPKPLATAPSKPASPVNN